MQESTLTAMSGRIRMLCLVDSLPPERNELDSHSLEWLSYLDPDTFEIEVGVLSGPCDSAADGLNVPVHSLNLSPSGFWRNPIHRLAVKSLLRRCRPHCLCAFGNEARIVGLPVAHALGIPLRVAVVHDLGENLTSPVLAALQLADDHATRFLVNAYAVARRLVRQEKVGRTRIDIISPGVDCGRFPPRTPETVAEAKHRVGLSVHQPVVLLAGPIVPSQDHTCFLAAAAQLRPNQPDARFVIAGPGRPEAIAALKRALGGLGLSGQVIFCPEADAWPQWLQAADVGVTTAYAEACSPVLLRYMAAGLPIVAANVGGNSVLVQHGESGYLVDFRDPDQLAMFIMVLLLSPELSSRFGEAASRRVREDFPRERARRSHNDYFRTLVYSCVAD